MKTILFIIGVLVVALGASMTHAQFWQSMGLAGKGPPMTRLNNGTQPPPNTTITSVMACGSNTCNFQSGTTNAIGQAAATLSNGGMFSGSWTEPTTGNTSASIDCNPTQPSFSGPVAPGTVVASCTLTPQSVGGPAASSFAISGNNLVVGAVALAPGTYVINATGPGDACPNNAADFTISAAGLLASTPASQNTSYVICIAAAQNNLAPPNPYVQLVQLNPSQQMPSTQCPSTAPAPALQAGMTTMALCNDFTQAIPNTAGTGLPANWLGLPAPGYAGGAADCNPHVWYSQDKGFFFGGSPNTAQVIDPRFGNLALLLPYDANDQQHYSHSFLNTAAVVCMTSLSQTNLYLDFPEGMFIRFVGRNNINTVICSDTNTVCNEFTSRPKPNADFFTWTTASDIGIAGQGQVMEQDQFENISNHISGGGPHEWWQDNGGGGGANFEGPHSFFGGTLLPAGFDDSQYHTYDMLTTTDGQSNVMNCSWVDGVFYQCHLQSPNGLLAVGCCVDNSGTAQQRNDIHIWSANLEDDDNGVFPGCPDSTNTYQPYCVVAPVNFYIESVQVWSCADWRRGSTGPNPSCAGPALVTNGDGSQTYTVTTQ